ncbi:hypothetical protein HWV07_13945 [Natronomonas salina]|uniref:hypothetical protein n=1 Tax=Natronomonas salina TaxID=1710540 RepID=UPI0015B69CFD|nr:hypothetical protein [Natronomonas salina]QLD90074.1 hypothetical protein HWV07_13945 [Natronomonas salina]
MPEAKTLAVGVAILTILGMTIALAVPLGPSIAGDDDPENSGVTSAQEDPVNSTDNGTDDNSTDTDNDGDDDDPEDNDGSGENGSSDSPPCESDGDSSDSSGESDCGSSDDGADDQDGEKNKDDDDNGDDGSSGDGADDGNNGDGADDKDGSKDKDDDNGDDGNGGTGDDGNDDNETDDGDDNGGENGTDVIGTCEENGLVMNNTIANEAFGTENESGPISGQLHDNEEQFQNASVIVHEGSCVIATVDNNANGSGGDGGPSDQLPGGDNGSDDGSDGSDGNETDDGNDGNETDDGTGDDGELGTCETGGAIQDNTLANEIFGTENESGPISSQLHDNEAQFQNGSVIVHEASCGVATVDNNANSSGDDGSSDQLPESP